MLEQSNNFKTMGRSANYPTTIEDLRCFDINFLSRYDYLKPQTYKGGQVIWTSAHGTKNTIGIEVKINLTDGIIRLDYTHNQTNEINYTIQIISRSSNLGTGLIWFFVCPFTGKICRKLHLINGYFKHRTANPYIMYSKQIECKRWRKWNKRFAHKFNDGLYDELYSKHFTPFYKGKITKRHARLLKRIQQREAIELPQFLTEFKI